MQLKIQSDQAIANSIVAHVQAIRLKKNISLEDLAKNAGISRQTLHAMLNHGKGTLINLIGILRAIGELERLSSLLEGVRPSPLQVIRMEGKKRQRASSRRAASTESPTIDSKLKKNSDW